MHGCCARSGHASMVDVGGKKDTARVAVASGRVMLGKAAFELVKYNKMAKGDVLTTAKLAGEVFQGGSLPPSMLASHPRMHGNAVRRRQGGQLIWKAPCCAGIMGAKQTSSLIPLCHSLMLSKVDVCLALHEADASVQIRSEARTVGKTGVEMEALTAVSVAALTVYDMCKAVSKGIVIQDICLESKEGGKSSNYSRDPAG